MTAQSLARRPVRVSRRCGSASASPTAPLALATGAASPSSPEQSAWSTGVVSISFDDSFGSQYTKARPILDGYGYGATAYAIQEVVGTSGYCTLAQLQELQENSGWHIGGHAYYLASHATGLGHLSTSDLDKECRLLRPWLDDNGFKGRDHLAWPLGDFNSSAIQVVAQYFASARAILARTRAEHIRPSEPYRMHSFSVTDSNQSQVAAEIDKCAANKSWLHLTFHNIVDGSPGANDITTAHFQSIVDYIHSKGLLVRTVDEVLRKGAA